MTFQFKEERVKPWKELLNIKAAISRLSSQSQETIVPLLSLLSLSIVWTKQFVNMFYRLYFITAYFFHISKNSVLFRV